MKQAYRNPYGEAIIIITEKEIPNNKSDFQSSL